MTWDCCVFNCPNRRSSKNRKDLDSPTQDELQPKIKLKLHVFPLKDVYRLEKWVKVLLPYVKKGEDWRVTKDTRVCSQHFLVRDYHSGSDLRSLRDDAVPSVFMVDKIADIPEYTSEDSPLWMRIVEKCIYFPHQDSENPSEGHMNPLRIKACRSGRYRCRALGCTSMSPERDVYGTKLWDADLSFHKIPYRLDIFKKWVEAVGRRDIQPSASWYLCSRHFTPDCFNMYNGQAKRLKPSSVPTLFWLPPPELLHCVEPSAPYLQPRVVLQRVDEPEPPVKPVRPQIAELPVYIAPREAIMEATMHDHMYIKVEEDPEEEVARLKTLLEELKDKVMSTSQRVKSLKISVSALKYQYQLEKESLTDNGQAR